VTVGEPQRTVVEYQQPRQKPAPTGGEVVVGTVVVGAAVLFGLQALLLVVGLFALPGYRENVGITVALAVALVFGLIAAFCGRFGLELFHGRRPNRDESK
jgi:hypothetical protein